MKPIWLSASKIYMMIDMTNDIRITVVMDGELTHDFTGDRMEDDHGIAAVLWAIDAGKDVELFIDDIKYSFPTSDCTNFKSVDGFVTQFPSWKYKTLRDHLKHCVDIHRSFYSEHA